MQKLSNVDQGDAAGELSARHPDVVRVVHVLDSFEAGGAQRVTLQLSRWLVEHGAEVAVFGKEGELSSQISNGIPHPYVEETGFIGETIQLARFCRSFRPQILHAHQRREALMCLIVGRVLGIPFVEHAHTYLPDRRFAALSFRGSRIFAVSDQVQDMVTKEFGRRAARTIVVGNTASSVSSAPVRPWEPRPDGSLRIVGIGRLVEQKDPSRFVRVIAAAARRTPVEAIWLGDGPLLEEARDLAESLGAPVRFVGQSAHVTTAIDESDAVLMTSRWEGMPLAVLEAFARRRAVVATEAAGGSGVLGAGRAHVVPDDATDEQFAGALVDGMSDAAGVRARVAAAYAYSSDAASPDRVFGPVLDSYDLLVNSRPAARRRRRLVRSTDAG